MKNKNSIVNIEEWKKEHADKVVQFIKWWEKMEVEDPAGGFKKEMKIRDWEHYLSEFELVEELKSINDTLNNKDEISRLKIKCDIGRFGCISCLQNCIYSRTCSNHSSAGDYRCESGFTPELIKEGEEIYCATILRPTLNNDVEILPDNYNDLGQGYLIIKDGVLRLDY